MREAVIVDAVRTPLGRGKPTGALHPVHAVDLGAAGLLDQPVGMVQQGCVPPLDRLPLNQRGDRVDIPADNLGAQLDGLHDSGTRAGERIKHGQATQLGSRTICLNRRRPALRHGSGEDAAEYTAQALSPPFMRAGSRAMHFLSP